METENNVIKLLNEFMKQGIVYNPITQEFFKYADTGEADVDERMCERYYNNMNDAHGSTGKVMTELREEFKAANKITE